MTLLPHPSTGTRFPSPVLPGTSWPGDPATASTPVAHSPDDVAALAADATLGELEERVSVCRACPRLVEWRENVASTKRAGFAGQPYWGRPAPSWGDPGAGTLIIGLAPAAHGANRTGRIFTGDRSGDWLFASLHRTGFANQATSVDAADGLELTGIRIASPVHCAPPANQPSTDEKATCAPWLDRELALLTTVRWIVALGGVAWAETLKAARRLGWAVPSPAPKFRHGHEATLGTSHGDLRLVGCYHVSQHNTFTGRLTEPMLDEIFTRTLA